MFNFLLMHGNNILNQLLALDPNTPTRLQPLRGKILEIKIDGFPHSIYFLFGSKSVALQFEKADDAVAVIQGPPTALLQSLYAMRERKTQLNSTLTLQGDLETVQDFNQLLQGLDIDWEEQLSKIFGDTLARFVSHKTQTLFTWANQTIHQLKENLTEYLQEERLLMPPKAEIEDFYQDVAMLRDDVERAEIRIKRLLDS